MNVETFKQTLKGLENKHLDSIMLHPKHYEALMRFENPTKWEIFLDGFRNFWNCLDCYNDGDTWGYDEFWEGLNLGWYMEYIYPYDDDFNPATSHVRQLRLDAKPYVHTIYVSEEAYDKLVEAINKPPEYNEKIARVLSRKAPWDEEND